MTMEKKLTKPQEGALRWLYNHGGSGIFNKNGVLMARGDLAGVMRSTWNVLRDARLITIDKKRIVTTKEGEQYCRSHPGITPSTNVEEDD